jgi:GAF domain
MVTRNQLSNILLGIGTAAIVGIIGNRADAAFLSALPILGNIITIRLWTLPIIIVATYLPLCLTIHHYRKAHAFSTKINRLDERLMRLLPQLSSVSAEVITDRLIDDVFACFDFLQECSIAVYKPSPSNPADLILWRDKGLSVEHIRSFYIGDQRGHNFFVGVQGTIFKTQKQEVVHIWKEGSRISSDFNPSNNYPVDASGRLSYQAMVCSPIINESNKTIGVLCLYSRSRVGFDSENTQKLVSSIAEKVSAILVAAQNIPRVP